MRLRRTAACGFAQQSLQEGLSARLFVLAIDDVEAWLHTARTVRRHFLARESSRELEEMFAADVVEQTAQAGRK